MPLWMQLLMKGGIIAGPTNGEGNDLGGGAGDPPADQPADPPADDNSDDDNNPGDDDNTPPKANKPTDKEAELLKEVMKRKESEKALKQKLATLEQKVAGLDLDEVHKLLQERKAQEERELEARGDFDRLKQRMADEHAAEVERLKQQINEYSEKERQRESQINDLTIGTKFSQSKYVVDQLTLTPSKARALYGAHFELEDGVVVGYDKPRGASERTQLIDGRGNTLSFDDAMQKIIEADPECDALIRSKVKPGSGSGSKPNANTPDQNQRLTAREKIAAGLKTLT